MKTKISPLLVGLVILALASVGQTWTRTGSDLGSRVAALEAQQAANSAQIATNTADIAALTAALASHVGNTTTAHNYDARYVRHQEGTLRVLRGWVWADGTVLAGTPGVVTRDAVGTYTITHNFGDWAAPLITPQDTDPPCFVRWNGFGTSSYSFSLRDHTLLLNSDQDWSYAAFGH